MKFGFTILEHPADLGIEAYGTTLAGAFEHAADGLMSIIVDLTNVELSESRPVDVSGSDSGQLLVRWLTEVLWLFDGQQFVGKEFRIVHLDETSLKGIVVGERLAAKHQTLTDVKAVTYHQLLIHQTDERAEVTVFVDI